MFLSYSQLKWGLFRCGPGLQLRAWKPLQYFTISKGKKEGCLWRGKLRLSAAPALPWKSQTAYRCMKEGSLHKSDWVSSSHAHFCFGRTLNTCIWLYLTYASREKSRLAFSRQKRQTTVPSASAYMFQRGREEVAIATKWHPLIVIITAAHAKWKANLYFSLFVHPSSAYYLPTCPFYTYLQDVGEFALVILELKD